MSGVSHFIQIDHQTKLSFTRFKGVKNLGVPILMVHGAIENGRIFYPRQNWGLAPYLAGKGYDVFVLDLRGRGRSVPAIDKNSTYGQYEAICEDIPAAFQEISKLTKNQKQIWIAHSWGGVLMASSLARFPEMAVQVKCQVYLGTKRRVRVQNPIRWLLLDLYWYKLAKLATAYYGYLPKKFMGIGSDAETKKSHADSCDWVKQDSWVDTQDGFDYGDAIKKIQVPPTLYLAGQNDACLGNPQDVKLFMNEVGGSNDEFRLLCKANGYHHDYGHIDMLTNPDCYQDHFPAIDKWISNSSDTSQTEYYYFNPFNMMPVKNPSQK